MIRSPQSGRDVILWITPGCVYISKAASSNSVHTGVTPDPRDAKIDKGCVNRGAGRLEDIVRHMLLLDGVYVDSADGWQSD
jgi:hypothetical protein